MKTKKSFRNAFGLGQIMATLLVVLPTLAFSVTFMIEYWSIMQIDYKLKLIANMGSTFANSRTDLRNWSDGSGGNASDLNSFIASASSLCPGGKTLQFGPVSDGSMKGEIDITVQYTTPEGTYLGTKTLSTNIKTYSYHDQNMSVVLTCPTNQ
ncbi:hypothetical protein JHD47_03355 [Sulfurimonas sp. SAG-AH-194-L11]|nr:hypothetical protein [Sulfurimonas sp. SAG-AH-194-L11]MDF1876850.1 hypothetical protein [Sulfurimonas sp. SAG-AH-194-L11]